MLSKQALYAGFKKVWKAKGAAGIEGQSLSDFATKLDVNLELLLNELREKRYQPLPVRRVDIPKEDGGTRQLGIPAVRDRVVQQALLDILNPIFDPEFHPSSYGYRPGRSCHQAISKATLFIRQYHRRWVVDMDLSKCFDMLDHELIIKAFRRRVTDSSILNLLRQFLQSGVMVDGQWEATRVGSPQGGVISPLIANVYLDEFDQEMKRRHHRIVRYADDILILCGSRAAAEQARQVATQLLEGDLRLKVNERKTHLAHSDEGIKFLGVEISTNYTRIQEKKLISLKARVKALTKRNRGSQLSRIISELNAVLRGFGYYFRIANSRREYVRLMQWIRRRLRCIQLVHWKRPTRLHKRLRQLGYKGRFKSIKMASWRSSASPLASYAMPNAWFDEQGLFNLTKIKTGQLALIY
ncbi:group II intron reverse transcriptase/maturase [Colwellia sp. MB3u-22]|uniref:group II intron reverse transcriptase/maturase n=1 Tax=Colwellia sp. MB3u-22 TaxID=2759813 RepID=UPI0015F4414A|nr:group II intron reverse transcriptase/maturase [Colwellia sp. MB3u-22]MBA6297854.1 group II intron reverse transcriptase/maturase [Colwellia sp. MB3u-22]